MLVVRNDEGFVFLKLELPFFMRHPQVHCPISRPAQRSVFAALGVFAPADENVVAKVTHSLAGVGHLCFFHGQRQFQVVFQKIRNLLFEAYRLLPRTNDPNKKIICISVVLSGLEIKVKGVVAVGLEHDFPTGFHRLQSLLRFVQTAHFPKILVAFHPVQVLPVYFIVLLAGLSPTLPPLEFQHLPCDELV